MTKDEVLKLALSTLNEVRSETFRLLRNGQKLYAEEKVWNTITAIKEALNGCQCPECQVKPHASDCAVHNEPAYPKGKCNCGAQPEQEPVAYQDTAEKSRLETVPAKGTLLYATPPQRKPLTDEEIDWMTRGNNYPGTVPGARRFARAIEAAHGIGEKK